jgi:SAM-dependent methyltransferase
VHTLSKGNPLLTTKPIPAFFKVLLQTLLFNPTHLVPFSQIRSQAFAQAWQILGSTNKPEGPLKNIVSYFASATGIVLDLGPGDGRQTINYSNPGIKAIYGAEPCKELHAGLRKSAEEAGLGSRYRILDCGAQRESLYPALREVGLLGGKVEGLFDSIICSKVLCSVPNQEATVAALYDVLKPGGKMIVCEHIKNPWRSPKGSLVARGIQQLFMAQGWSYFLGGCHLTRETGEVMKRAADRDGGWKKVDLEYVVTWGAIPFVLGVLVKKG